jgi:alkanesulfonate monooxygenase SsuD/methylene tetrahydromethanopterin reductase-like flavin-dependent oxidoreductase (luciferase family)
VRVGVCILPELRWPQQLPLWQRAEELGFDHAWTYDHLAWRSLRDEPWFGAVPTLTAAALATTRLRIGPLVASPNFRNPVPFAKELVTLDDVSGGRLTLGIGAGGEGWDATMLGEKGWPRAERTARFEEFVDLLDRLLREPETSFDGRWYSAHEARTYPGCVQQPRVPFAVAATGPRGMRLAATYGQTWVTTGEGSGEGILGTEQGAAAVGQQIARLDDACAAVGRDPASIDRLVLTGPVLDAGLGSEDAFGDAVGRYAEVGVTDLVVHWPRPTEPYAGDVATFERIFTSFFADPRRHRREGSAKNGGGDG